MPVRTSGGVFNDQMLTGSLVHYVICGADFSGAVNSFGQPVPFSAAEIIFKNIESGAYVNIMNPNECNLSFALEADRSVWNEISLTTMVQGLGSDVGVDHIDCSVCVVKQVPYIWGCGVGAETFLDLTDTPATYAGAAGYIVTVDGTETGLIFSPAPAGSNAFATVAVPTQPNVNAVGSDTLTFIAGTNMVITTNSGLKTVTFDASGSGTPDKYIPVPPATALAADTRYYVTSSGTVTLPLGVGLLTSGTFVKVTKKPGDVVFINTVGGDDISTDLGNDTSIEFDATQECVFIFDGTSTWNLQIGSKL
jgi:hypothetical protein